MTDTDMARLSAKQPHDELRPGIDYTVREGGLDWLPYPDVPACQSIRHIWIMTRRRRPTVPSFAGSPMPNHRPEEDARAASIVMSYFHPWTLRVSDATEHVPFAGNLRKSSETWQDAMSVWLDGNIICEESRRYVGNYLSVHRMRPVDDDASAADNSDDLLSDEDLTLSSESLLDALRTRIGGVAHNDTANSDKRTMSLTTTPTRRLLCNSAKQLGVVQRPWQTQTCRASACLQH